MFCIFKKKISFCIVSLSYLESRKTLFIFNVFVVVCFIVVAFALVLFYAVSGKAGVYFRLFCQLLVVKYAVLWVLCLVSRFELLLKEADMCHPEI